MRKKIFNQMVLLASAGIFLASIVVCAILYGRFTAQARTDLLERTEIFAKDSTESAMPNLTLVRPSDMRITLILPDGTVLYDNMANPQDLSSHLDREEIEQAFSLGEGESRRFSDTLRTETYYYAVRLTDGAVLRTAKTVSSVWSMFAGILPVIVAAVLLFIAVSYLVSLRLAKRVVEPIGNMDFGRGVPAPYDELTPFVRTILQHRQQIARDGERLQERTDTINAIMDNMSEGVVLLDRRGSILSVNKSAARIFGTAQSMEGRSALELLRDLDFSEHIGKALQGQRGEMTFQKSDREYRAMISPVSGTGVVVLFLDMTERAEAERMRREFSANVSHELKTPLTSIYGTAELLREGVIEEKDKPLFYGKIMNEASRLITLIEDILMLSRLDEDSVQERLEEVELAGVASACAQSLEQKAAEHQVTVSVAGSGTMTANRSLIYEMFYNLIDNAIKYNRPGGKIDISITQARQDIEIVVADNGIGIAEKDQGRIFERFYRADKSRSKKSGGTGLGLAIVKHVVLTHGGSIGVSSKPEQGTQFRIIFPAPQS